MILKVSKLLTTALLLAVNFNSSYAVNSFDNNNIAYNNYPYETNINNILIGLNQFNSLLDNRHEILTGYTEK